MLDISIAELLLVGIVGLLTLGPKELLAAIKSLRGLTAYLQRAYEEFMSYLNKELDDSDDYIKIIFDDEGQPQKVYDLEKIKPYLKDEGENDPA